MEVNATRSVFIACLFSPLEASSRSPSIRSLPQVLSLGGAARLEC
jgi:hypothetical protein